MKTIDELLKKIAALIEEYEAEHYTVVAASITDTGPPVRRLAGKPKPVNYIYNGESFVAAG